MLTPEPAPRPGRGDVVATMLDDPRVPANLKPYLAYRREQGIAKYGTPLGWDDGRNMGPEVAQELMDLYIYSYKMLRVCPSNTATMLAGQAQWDSCHLLLSVLSAELDAFKQRTP